MNQDDPKELSEIGRSIDSLFARAEGVEGVPTGPSGADPSGGAASSVPEVDVAPEDGGQPDASAEPDLTSEPGPSSEETPGDPEPIPGELAPKQPEVGNVLSEAASDYLQAPVGERGEAESALRSAVEAARASGALDEIASSVDLLLLQAPGDPDVADLASEFADAGVLARMVARLGRVMDEVDREPLIEAYVRLGGPIADSIADALTDTEDRMARKTYVAALAAFGSDGAQAIEKMLKDSRWFVVRNGVAVLGVVGGASAIEHLTGSLANEHAGVRRETVRSLAKVGGENAGLLVSSMLGDSDPEVRAEAARAVSALKAERGYKQLLEILKRGDEDEVIEQVLRALGGLGDASAVPAIEKRLKGSFFSSPAPGVRIAGLSALASIGTPYAVSLVEKAKADKDPEVSAAARQLLAGT